MAKAPTLHPYSDRAAFDRLMILIATLLEHPGVGSRQAKRIPDQEALEDLSHQMQSVATQLGFDLPDYSVHTLRKDLVTLRNYNLLDRNRHDWGYYLGMGVMNRQELQVALQSLAVQATQQGNAQARQLYSTLKQRLRGLNLDLEGQLFYPVRTQFNRVIVHTDPQEMMRLGQYRHTLFHTLDIIETAIVQGQKVELYRHTTPYKTATPGTLQVYPLQLLYSEIAWYLLFEHDLNGHLEIERVDRFSDSCQLLDPTGRGISKQQESLQMAHQLLIQGWGLYLGDPKEQLQERLGQLPLVKVTVRFFPPITAFILEGERRHPKQKIRKAAKHQSNYVDYSLELPRRSLGEFVRWVQRFMNYAKILAPPELAERHLQGALELVKLYGGE